eukprot:INCI10203.3.p2 GENE.INCI10203.3~~INCI10203.3.p2  ORF type:complete len:116 (-),score=11.65 INCI10203.3:360-707(-)
MGHKQGLAPRARRFPQSAQEICTAATKKELEFYANNTRNLWSTYTPILHQAGSKSVCYSQTTTVLEQTKTDLPLWSRQQASMVSAVVFAKSVLSHTLARGTSHSPRLHACLQRIM